MLKCSVCGNDNNDLALACSSCKGFLQTKIGALDLFATVWGLIETPRATFKRIALATHKTYVFLLSSLFGICLVFAVFRLKNAAHRFPDLYFLLVGGVLSGPFAGLLWVFLTGGLAFLLCGKLGGKGTLRNNIAVTSYAMVPLVLLLVFVFPVEVALFGNDLFGENPSPMIIKPDIYPILMGFDAGGMAWSLFLLGEGMSIANSVSRWKGFMIAIMGTGITVGGAVFFNLV